MGEENMINPGEVLYNKLFYPCRTIMLFSKSGEERRFVEISEGEGSHGDDNLVLGKLEIALENVVKKLINEGENDFFYESGELDKVKPVIVNGRKYWLKYKDRSDTWPRHFFTRTRKPLIGFKATKTDGTPILPSGRRIDHYAVGKTSVRGEKELLNDGISGPYFSPYFEKAYSYRWQTERDQCKIFTVRASGLTFVKNCWNDLTSSKIEFLHELTSTEIKQLLKAIPNRSEYTVAGVDGFSSTIWAEDEMPLLVKKFLE